MTTMLGRLRHWQSNVGRARFVLVPLVTALLLLGCGDPKRSLEHNRGNRIPPGATGSAGGAGGGGGRGGAGATGTAGQAGGAATGGSGALGGSATGGSATGGASSATGGSAGSAGTNAPGATAGAGGSAGSAGGAGGQSLVHDRCRAPLPLTFVDGQISVTDDLARGTDEFPQLLCGPGKTVVGLSAGQLYYRFTARAGMKYELRLKAGGFDGLSFYVFPAAAACTADAIQAACTSGGKTGTIPANSSSTALTAFAPTEPGDYIVGVDSISPGLKSLPFTLTIFEFCDTSKTSTDCKIKVCDQGIEQTCSGNVRNACNAAGTAYVSTDCAATGAVCNRGTCSQSVFDPIGGSGWDLTPADTAGAAGATVLDFYSVNVSRSLIAIESSMLQSKSTPLQWLVYESSTQAGPYQQILSRMTTVTGSFTIGMESSGLLEVPLVAGRFYAIGIAFPAGATYSLARQKTARFPSDVSFGQLTSSTVLPSAAPTAAIMYPAPGTTVYPQRLTTGL